MAVGLDFDHLVNKERTELGTCFSVVYVFLIHNIGLRYRNTRLMLSDNAVYDAACFPRKNRFIRDLKSED